MAKNSGIDWTEHTLNPWWGCVKVSAGCKHCYAETWANRTGNKGIWGPDADRRFFKPKHFNQVLKWDQEAGEAGRFDRVMVGSMCDIFEIHKNKETNDRMNEARARIWELIGLTDNLIWILVTKRPEYARVLVPPDWSLGAWPGNVWAMVTTETQEMAEKRMPWLEEIPARVRAISAEPLLGVIDPRVYRCGRCYGTGLVARGQSLVPCRTCGGQGISIDWLIAGGESGANARPMDPRWVRPLRDFAEAYSVPFVFKQWGEWAPADPKLVTPAGVYTGPHRSYKHDGSDTIMAKVGKKAAGNLLDGKEWMQRPDRFYSRDEERN